MLSAKLGISTMWRSQNNGSAEELLAPLRDMEVDGLELEYRIPESTFRGLVPLLKAEKIPVLSLHNYCPHPQEYSKMRSSGDLFSLASLDKDERNLAVKWTSRTLEWAEELQAHAVVLHLGEVDLGLDENPRNLYKRVLHSVIGDHAVKATVDRHLSIRAEKISKYLDAAFFSLEKLDKLAEKRGISLGIENRYFYHQIPNYDEVGEILKRFGTTGYWHDFGHGNAQEHMGIIPGLEMLKTYNTRLLGVHIHDAVGLDDHKGIGEGNINYEGVNQLLPPGTLRILELHPTTALSQVRNSIHYVREHLLK